MLVRLTNIEMVSVFLWWEFTTLFYDTMPAIVGSVLVDFFARHSAATRSIDEVWMERRVVAIREKGIQQESLQPFVYELLCLLLYAMKLVLNYGTPIVVMVG